MLDIFKQIFAKDNLSGEKIQKYAADFSFILLLTVLASSKDKLNEADKVRVRESLEKNSYEDVWALLKQKYSEEEFTELCRLKIAPLLEEYTEAVRK